MTLQEMHSGDENGPVDSYWPARAHKVAAIAEYITDQIKGREFTAEWLAERLMCTAEEMGRIDGDDVSGEVASRYTTTGNPLTFII